MAAPNSRPAASPPARQAGRVEGFRFMLSIFSLIIISLAEGSRFDLTEIFSAVATCINNVGPGLGAFGPMYNFAELGYLSKIVLTLDMLMGRLEIVPILLLFYPKAWIPAK